MASEDTDSTSPADDARVSQFLARPGLAADVQKVLAQTGNLRYGDRILSIRPDGLAGNLEDQAFWVFWRPRKSGFVPGQALLSYGVLREKQPKLLIAFWESFFAAGKEQESCPKGRVFRPEDRLREFERVRKIRRVEGVPGRRDY